MKIELEQDSTDWSKTPGKTILWAKSLPLVKSKNGGLLWHRVRYAGSFIHDGVRTHDYTNFWCGNSFTNFKLTDDPGKNEFVCLRCEAAAVAHGLPAISDLIGRHVCTGSVKSFRDCSCQRSNHD